MTAKQPILITGSHRSGTTWVGRMLAEAPSVFYIHEPFSVTDPPSRGICNAEFKHWFTYITPENEANYYRPIKNTIELKYDCLGVLKTIKSRKDFRLARAEYRQVSSHRSQCSTALMKDPIAVFSAAWLAERFESKIVVLIRHPAAFVSSIKKLNWEHPFEHFLKQPLMMQNILFPFQSEIEEYSSQRKPIFDQAILLWRIIHHQILNYQKEHLDWIFIRHEDISQDPLGGFQDLFSKLNLEFTEKVRAAIEDHSGSSNPSDTSAPVGSDQTLKRDSKSNIWNWKNRLSDSEIKEIRNRVEDISHSFYSNNDW